ncbi:hypothetical protein QHH11_16280 [Aphanizomenon sp. PH219]|nr:hypothetical protein [Aphanizomenon sp. 202]MDK2460676.1 hypothetical protein [Aphanizomenon sp. PH219]
MLNYTTSTTDTKEYKRLITGRADDITKLIDDITQGNSVVLFGERRIGKTSLLYLIRDIINNNIDNYQNTLIDSSLRNFIDGLKIRISAYKVIYIDIATLQNEGDTIEKLIYENIKDENLFQNFSINITSSFSLIEIFKYTKPELQQNNNRLLILVDESERLCNLSKQKQDDILSSIKSITQTSPEIQFILAGAEPWYSNFKRDDNPLRNVKFYYLKSAAPSAIREDLIRKPFLHYLNPDPNQNPPQKVIDIVEIIGNYTAEWTGYKPSYVQSVCYEMKQFLQINNNELKQEWDTYVLKKVESQEEDKTLKPFYQAQYIDNISKDILALLAHKHELNRDQIINQLSHSKEEIWDKLEDLQSLDKIRKNQSEKYHIVGTLVEKWGKENIPLPSIKNEWIQYLTWTGAIIFVSLAIGVYFYTHPSLKSKSCQFISSKNDFPKSQVLIYIPSSLEEEENGKVTLLVSNLDQKEINPLLITLSSLENQIQYQKDNTNLIKTESLSIGETKYYTLDFIVRDSLSKKILSSIVVISDIKKQSINKCDFDIKFRSIPIKRYWGIISLFLTAIGGFIVKKDLPQLLTTLLGLFSNK